MNFPFKELDVYVCIYIYIYKENNIIITMSAFCKGCKKTKDNEDSGINNNGSQYNTCVKCRDYDRKRVEKEKNKASESNGELK